MKQFKLSFLLFVLMSMLSNKASAHEAEINGIYYNFSGDEATVTYKGESYGSYEGEYSGSIVIPETVEYNAHTYTVTSIGDNAFYGCTGLTSIEIPNSVTSIGGWAFNECSGLTSIEIPTSVTSIGNCAFRLCSGLTSIEIPNSVTSIGDAAFMGLEKIQSVFIPASVTDMGTNPFRNCDGIYTLYVSSDNERYYSWMNGIVDKSTQTLIMASKNTSIPSSVKIIGRNAFCFSNVSAPYAKYRDVDRSVILPEGVEELAQSAINSTHIGTLHIPSTIKRVYRGSGNDFFNWSTIDVLELTDIKAWCEAEVGYWASLPNIGEDEILELHHDGVEIQDLVIPNNTSKIGDLCFARIKGITSVKIPNSVTSIGKGAFFECSGLTSVEIPSSVTSIGESAFEGCTSLTSIEIPSSVTSIGSSFYKCNSLTVVKVGWQTPITGCPFSTNRTNATLYVPRGSKAAYEAANYWKEFKEIVEYDANAEITMGSSGITTYSSNYNLDFTSVSGLRAYIASGFSPSTGELAMLRIYKVPAGEGILLKGEPGSYEVPGVKSDYIYANMLVGVPKATTVEPTDGEYTNFILANDEVKGIGFYPLASAGEIGPNKAYLQVLSSAFAAARSLRMVFEDEEEEEITGINALNDKGKMINDKAVYDLQGRRVIKPTRGLYIRDGKKIMVK